MTHFDQAELQMFVHGRLKHTHTHTVPAMHIKSRTSGADELFVCNHVDVNRRKY